MSLIYFGLVVLLSSCGLWCVDCAPSLTPTNDNPVYVADGAGSYDLSWDYNTDGGTIKKVELLYRQGNVDKLVAVKSESPNQALVINPTSGYSGRITFFIGSGRVTFTISNIVQSDSRIFKCQLSFTGIIPAPIQSSTDFVVVVPPKITLKSPVSVTLNEGDAETLLCVASGNPTPSIAWTKDSAVVTQTSNTNYTIASAAKNDAGTYTCTARVTVPGLSLFPDSYSVSVTVRYKPTIKDLPQSVYTVNETNNVTMVCQADGVSQPTITWTKTSSGKNVGYGEQFHIINTRGSDDGAYRCTATNELGSDSKVLTLHVQTRPIILTSTPITTNIPGAPGEEVDLTCNVIGKPTPTLSWKRDPKGNDLNSLSNKVKSITSQEKTITMKVIVANVGKKDGDKYYCFAVNLLGNDTQEYIIRERGPPDPPVGVKLIPFQVPDSPTVSVNVSWTPGYSGGFDQEFLIHYRKKGSGGDFEEESLGHPASNMHTVNNLSPKTQYEFKMQASNQRGKSKASALVQVMTSDSAVLDRGKVKATRMSDDPTVIIVTWIVTDEKVTKLSLEIQEGGEFAGWAPVIGASDMSTSTAEFKVENLYPDNKYRLRLDMRRPGEDNPSYVESNMVSPTQGGVDLNRPVYDQKGLSAAEVSGIMGGVGILLVVIVALAVCIFWLKRRTTWWK